MLLAGLFLAVRPPTEPAIKCQWTFQHNPDGDSDLGYIKNALSIRPAKQDMPLYCMLG